MALLDHNGESEFPFPKNQVFDALSVAIPSIPGLKIKNSDKMMGRVLVKGGVSLASWGENIPIQLIEISESKTRIQITSSPKTGLLMGGAFDMGKNRKNIESILNATSNILSIGDYNSNFYNPQQALDRPKKKLTVGKIILYVFLGFISLSILRGMFSTKEITNKNESASETVVTPNQEAMVVLDPGEQSIIRRLKAKAKEDWPDDYTTQEYWINQQVEAFRYMNTIADGSIKRKAQEDWPLDFSTQKYWYNEQIKAKERMSN